MLISYDYKNIFNISSYIIFFCEFLFAEESDSSDYKYWINIGLGGKHELESSFNFNYNFSFKNNFYQCGYHFSGAVIKIPNIQFLQPDKGNSFHALNFSYGDRIKRNIYTFAVFIGPSIIFGKKIDKKNSYSMSYSSFGFAFDAQYILNILEGIGFGIELYGNLNFNNNIVAISFIIHFSNNK